MTPGEEGFALCARVREVSGLSIVLLSGYIEEQSRVKGLTIVEMIMSASPYSLAELELELRVWALALCAG